MPTFTIMNVTRIFKTRVIPGTDQGISYPYYRLSESYRKEKGGSTKRAVLGLGELKGTTKKFRNRLGEILTAMIERNELPLDDAPKLIDLALHFYAKYQSKKCEAEEKENKNEKLQKAAEEKKAKEREEYVQIKLNSLKLFEARIVGAETIAL